VAEDIEALSFNKAVAKIYELANVIEKADAFRQPHRRDPRARVARGADDAASRRGSLGGYGAKGLIADAAWPEVDPALLVEDEVTVAVQVMGKLRDTITVAKGLPAHYRWRASKENHCGTRQAGQHSAMKRLVALACLAATLPTLASCGLHPLYANGSRGAVARAIGTVTIDPIEGKAGWLVANALKDRIAPISGGDGPSYRLHVELDDQIAGFGVRQGDTVTRERRQLRARYQLFDAATGVLVMDMTAASDSSFDAPGSEFATIAAEDTALERLADTVADQIVTRMAQKLATDHAPGAKAAP
jgi:LPS-assembly lipoprotein